MGHVTFVPLTGFRIGEEAMRELGMSLPGLTRRANAVGQLPALGLLTLAGLTPEPWTCSYRPAAEVTAQLVDEIAAERPTLVAISALTASVEEAYALCGMLRERGMATVMGGLHVSALPEEARRHADSVVVGRGEAVWPHVLRDVEAGRLQPQYASAMDANRAPATSAPWAVPRFDLLGSNVPRFTLQTQSGCPLACDFCGASRLLGRFQEKPVARIREELRAIGRQGARPLVELADDNTFAGGRNAVELLETLRIARVQYFTESDWRIGEREEIMERLAASGCAQVLIGIESLVFRYPGMGQKQAELARVMAAVERIQEAGVAVNGCFIVGAEGETEASIERLVQFLLESPLAEVQLTLQTPFPGTQLYERLKTTGRLLSERTWRSYTLFDVTYRPDKMAVRDLEAGFRAAVEAVFSGTASARRTQIRQRILQQRRRRLHDTRNAV